VTWLFRLFRRRQLEEQLDKEVRFHLDQHTADLIARGDRPDEAIRKAALAFGGRQQVKEGCRDARGTRWLEDLLQDFRYALRTLRQRVGFTAVTLSTLALGIGATTVMFTVIHGVLLRPLPYPDPERWSRYMDTPKNMAISGESHIRTFSTLSAKVALLPIWRHGVTVAIR
jgi:hypothetical protein